MASMARLHGLVAVSNCGCVLVVPFHGYHGALDGDFELAMVAFNKWLNVETWPSPAQSSCLWMLAACPVGLKSIGCRARVW